MSSEKRAAIVSEIRDCPTMDAEQFKRIREKISDKFGPVSLSTIYNIAGSLTTKGGYKRRGNQRDVKSDPRLRNIASLSLSSETGRLVREFYFNADGSRKPSSSPLPSPLGNENTRKTILAGKADTQLCRLVLQEILKRCEPADRTNDGKCVRAQELLRRLDTLG